MNSKKIKWLAQFYSLEKIQMLSDDAISELYEATQPKTVQIGDLEDKDVSKYLINSPDGFVKAHCWRNKGKKKCVTIKTESTEITASVDHFFEMSTGKWKYAEFIFPGEFIKSKRGYDKVISIEDASIQTVYDFHIDHENHRYYTNDLSSHNSGAGKSLFLQNLALNWVEAGFNVVYISLELSEELCSMRLDSMLTGLSTKELFKNIEDVALKVSMKGKKSGKLQIVQLPSGIDVNDIKAYIKEYQIQNDIKVDCILVDYLDLMTPAKTKVSADNVFLKDKHVSEELRNLAIEGDYLFATASQLNRNSVDEVEFDHSHIAGGISKINTADNVIGIFSSRAMREHGRVQIQFMKTRSSSGVGQKVDLAFNIDSLRITDLDSDDDDAVTATGNGLYDKLTKKLDKKQVSENIKTTVNDAEKAIKNADKLKSILRRSE